MGGGWIGNKSSQSIPGHSWHRLHFWMWVRTWQPSCCLTWGEAESPGSTTISEQCPSSMFWQHVCAQLLNHVWLFSALCTTAGQAPLSMEFSRQGYWSELPRPSPRDIPHLGNEPASPASPAFTSRFFTTASLPAQGTLYWNCLFGHLVHTTHLWTLWCWTSPSFLDPFYLKIIHFLDYLLQESVQYLWR